MVPPARAAGAGGRSAAAARRPTATSRARRATRAVGRVVAGALTLALLGGSAAAAPAPEDGPRLVVIKVDGLSPEAVEAFVARQNPRTGRPALPWIRRLFFDQGVRFANFYSRGASLSAPAWSVVDTGQPTVIRGNFEYDRSTGETYDHLNFVTYYYDAYKGRHAYPPPVEVLDAARTPILSDAFDYERRETGLQLIRRGTRWYDFLKVGLSPVKGPLGQRFGELLIGVDFVKSYDRTTRDAFLDALRRPEIVYADFYEPHVDKVLHDDNASEGLLAALEDLDRLIGSACEALERSGTLDRSVVAVVSDHGMTADLDGSYSQGVNLAAYLMSAEFGGHHLVTKDGPLAGYSLRNSVLKPWFTPPPVAVSRESPYLSARPGQVTCALDYDGNERANLSFRDPDLNRLQMLRQALRAGRLSAAQRAAAGGAVAAILDARRDGWLAEAAAVREELAAVGRARAAAAAELAGIEASVESGAAQAPAGRSAFRASDPAAERRQRARELQAAVWQADRAAEVYGAHAGALELRGRLRTAEDIVREEEDALFGTHDLGAPVAAMDLRRYPVALDRIVVAPGGGLDEASFRHVDYLARLVSLRVRNAPRADAGAQPVDYAAVRLPVAAAARALGAAGAVAAGDLAGVTGAVLVYGSDEEQLLLLERPGAGGLPAIRLVPVARAAATPGGGLALRAAGWRTGLPFRLLEDPDLDTGAEERGAWLSRFHEDREWLGATHRTARGLGVTGLAETLSVGYRERMTGGAAGDEALLRRFELRRRDAVQPDLFIEASPHWNFDLKDTNAGGNHGGFTRPSMHATWWMWGGPSTGVAPGPRVIEEPYDGLDVAPTLFDAAGLMPGGAPAPRLLGLGFRPFPGRVATGAFRPGAPR